MSTNYETGHAKNVANFEIVLKAIASFGGAYNPAVSTIKAAALQVKLTEVKQAANKANEALANYKSATALRSQAFEPLRKLSSRIISALKATSAPAQAIDAAMANHRKLIGARATPKLGQEQMAALRADGKEVKQVSASQQSFDSVLDTLDKQVKLLAAIPEYEPNETELKVASLEALCVNLLAKNNAVWVATAELDKARITRNQAMYVAETGMVALVADVKNYLRSVFGLHSQEYKQVVGLKFKQIKD